MMKMKIYNINGKLMEERWLPDATESVKLNASGYPDGIYLIRLSADGVESASKWSIRN